MVGRKGQSKSLPHKTPSRETFNCPVEDCEVKKRRDKLLGHVHTYVHFDKNGKPLHPSSGAFSKLKKSDKQHTKFFHEKEFDRLTPIKDILSGQISDELKKRQKFSPFEIASGWKRRLENPSASPSELSPKRRLIMPELEQLEQVSNLIKNYSLIFYF